MKKSALLVGIFLTCAFLSSAQVERKIVVEHFTNTKCSVCLFRNPPLNSNFSSHPEVLHISVHPSSPFSTCYLSQQNSSDNDARTNYYSLYGSTPRVVINGSVLSTTADYGDATLFTSYVGVSPISISIEQQSIGTDTIQSRIVIRRVTSGAPTGNAILFAGLVEDTVYGNGGNGEPKHYNVLRRSLYAPGGVVVALPTSNGDSLVMTVSGGFESFWDQSRIETVAILQDEVDKAVIQSALSSDPMTVPGTNIPRCGQSTLSIYPNPASNFIVLQSLTKEVFTYQIIDSRGEIIRFEQTNSKTLNLSDTPKGFYCLVIEQGENTYIRKLIKL